MFGVKEVRSTYAAERAQRRPQVLMIARREDAAASLPEARDATAIHLAQPVACVHGEEPELVEVGRIETAQHAVVTLGVCLAVARRDLAERMSLVVCERREMLAEQAE